MKKKDKIITYDYGKYIGETNEKDLPHGDGLLVCLNGEQYKGEFKEGKYDGYGQLDDLSGREYVGNFSDGKFNGKGKFKWKDEVFLNYYEGDFKNGTLSGKAIFKKVKDANSKTWIYEGDFDNGIQINGTVSWEEDGFTLKYKGEFKNNQMTGKGITRKIPKNRNDMIIKYEGDYIDGSIVKGVWSVTVNGLIEGKYEGGFKNGAFHGDGNFTTYLDDDGKYNKKGTKTHGKYVDGKLSTKTKISKFFSKFI